jgi:hypothetical protein
MAGESVLLGGVPSVTTAGPNIGSTDLAQVMAFLRSFYNGQLHWKHITIRRRFAKAIYLYLTRKYAFWAGKWPLSDIGKQAIAQGKLQGGPLALGGRRPARKSRWPMDMFLELSRSIIQFSHGNDASEHDFYVDPSKRHPDPSTPRPGHQGFPRGVPFPLLAYWLEYPRPYVIRMSVRQIAYLALVREGNAGRRRKRGKHGRGYLPDAKVINAQIAMKLPDRPVWRALAGDITKLFLAEYLEPLFVEITKEAQKFGAKPTTT